MISPVSVVSKAGIGLVSGCPEKMARERAYGGQVLKEDASRSD